MPLPLAFRYSVSACERGFLLIDYKIVFGSFCRVKHCESNTANGVSYTLACCVHDLTQAQHLIHFSASVCVSLPFNMAPVGQ